MFTYQALLKEAQALGADAIINVVIDKTIQTTTISNVESTSGSTITTWYGSALAIQYTDMLTESESITITNGDNSTTTTTTSVYFNEGGSAPVSRSSTSAGSSAPTGIFGGLIPASPEPAQAPVRGLRQ
jgi:hypothetical protein